MDEYLKNYYSVVRGRINSLRGHLDSRPSPSTETLKDRVPLAAFGLVGFLFQDVIGGPHSTILEPRRASIFETDHF